jgi:hypothetical protein
MKKFAFALLCLSVTVFVSCGSSEADAKKEKIKQDSLSKIDGDIAIDRANQLLNDSGMVTADSSAKIDTKAKK